MNTNSTFNDIYNKTLISLLEDVPPTINIDANTAQIAKGVLNTVAANHPELENLHKLIDNHLTASTSTTSPSGSAVQSTTSTGSPSGATTANTPTTPTGSI